MKMKELSNSTIIKALRACSDDDCGSCPQELAHDNNCLNELMTEAARRLQIIGDDFNEDRLKQLLQADRKNRESWRNGGLNDGK